MNGATSLPWGPPDRSNLSDVSGGATAAVGFRAGGVISGVKPSGKADLALLVADHPARVAAVTTTNFVKASSCYLTERHAANGRAQAIVINSGNANVCTPDGAAHTERLARSTASALGIEASDVLVMSTGVIGVPLPIDRIEAAIPTAVEDLSPDGGSRAAAAMMTTDTVTKQVAFEVTDEAGGRCVVGGMAKGVGMIEPSMATLLVALTTDAPVSSMVLKQLLKKVTSLTFNRISVDGDGSTSDTIALLSSGAATNPPSLDAISRGLYAVCADLAYAVVADGEGASRVAAVTVGSARNVEDAERLARSVATSLLVRAALHGADPNWGRILMAMGSAGVPFEPERVSVSCGGVMVCRFGVATAFDRRQAASAMDHPEVAIEIELNLGTAQATMLTCDLTPEYVRFNAEYTT